MAGTGWDSSDLLTKWNQYTGRPSSGDSIQDATKYQYLADAQSEVIGEMVSVAPKPFIAASGGPINITANTTDNIVFTFGVDGDGYPLMALATKIYPALTAIPDWPLIPGADYLDEGTQIRMPNNITLPFPALYMYGVVFPQRMSATVQPALQPPAARMLIVYKAVEIFANGAGVRNAQLADRMAAKYQLEFGKWMTTIRRHFQGGNPLGPLVTPFAATSQAFGGSFTW